MAAPKLASWRNTTSSAGPRSGRRSTVRRVPPSDMLVTRSHARSMKMIQVRNVPDDLHRALKARTALEGTKVSDMILGELPRLAHKPTPEQLLARIRERAPVPGSPAAELLAADRDER